MMNLDDENSRLDAVLSVFRSMAIFDDYELTSPQSRGMDGDTPLHAAVLLGRSDLLRNLLPYVSDIDVPGDLDNTPLHYAAMHGNVEAARVLIEKGADLYRKNDCGDTPLCIMQRTDVFSDFLG